MEFARALDVGDVDAARAVLRSLDVRALEMEPGTLEGTFVTRRPASDEVIERAARSWEAFDRLCAPRAEDWEPAIARFLDATGLVDWGIDHLFVCGSKVAAFSAESWGVLAAGWVDEDAIARCRIARSLGL